MTSPIQQPNDTSPSTAPVAVGTATDAPNSLLSRVYSYATRLIRRAADYLRCRTAEAGSIRDGHLERPTVLIAPGANVNAVNSFDLTPYLSLTLSLRDTNDDRLESPTVLIAPGANVNAVSRDGETPLHRAAMNGHVEAIKVLIEAGANVNAVNSFGRTPLHRAAMNSHVEAIKILIEAGANVNAVSGDGETPLHRAAMNSHVEAIRTLLTKGADIHAVDALGLTPFLWAVKGGHAEAIIATVANVNAVDRNGRTPLHWAAKEGLVKAIKVLIDNGASLDAQDNDGRTPLHQAAQEKQYKFLHEALKYNCNHSIQDNFLLTWMAEEYLSDDDSTQFNDVVNADFNSELVKVIKENVDVWRVILQINRLPEKIKLKIDPTIREQLENFAAREKDSIKSDMAVALQNSSNKEIPIQERLDAVKEVLSKERSLLSLRKFGITVEDLDPMPLAEARQRLTMEKNQADLAKQFPVVDKISREEIFTGLTPFGLDRGNSMQVFCKKSLAEIYQLGLQYSDDLKVLGADPAARNAINKIAESALTEEEKISQVKQEATQLLEFGRKVLGNDQAVDKLEKEINAFSREQLSSLLKAELAMRKALLLKYLTQPGLEVFWSDERSKGIETLSDWSQSQEEQGISKEDVALKLFQVG